MTLHEYKFSIHFYCLLEGFFMFLFIVILSFTKTKKKKKGATVRTFKSNK